MKDMARKKIIQKYYAERAKDYDQQKSRTWKSKHGFSTKIVSGIVDSLTGFENKTILEVGVGSGRISLPLLEKYALWLIGLDLSKDMLKLAKTKMSSHKPKCDLVLADAEHLPLADKVFDAAICISTMHYFKSSGGSLSEFSRILRGGGIFVYGDLTLHELDEQAFLDRLERTISKAHLKFYKSSKMRKLLENNGFHVSKLEVIPYSKSYSALIEDKGGYFDVELDTLREFVRSASDEERQLYMAGDDGLTLFFTLIAASKENN